MEKFYMQRCCKNYSCICGYKNCKCICNVRITVAFAAAKIEIAEIARITDLTTCYAKESKQFLQQITMAGGSAKRTWYQLTGTLF